jgi:PKD repeat protein
MRISMLPAVALLIAMAASLGCGGGSAGPPPPGTVPPSITAVSPLVVDANTEVKFTATTTGSAITRWTWTFGNAADPSTARNSSPTVDIGDPGTYDCRVIGENAWFETTTTFKLTVK